MNLKTAFLLYFVHVWITINCHKNESNELNELFAKVYEKIPKNNGSYDTVECKRHQWKCLDDGHCIERDKVCRIRELLDYERRVYLHDQKRRSKRKKGNMSRKKDSHAYLSKFAYKQTCKDGKDQDLPFCKTWNSHKVCNRPKHLSFKCPSSDRCVQRGLMCISPDLAQCPNEEDASGSDVCQNLRCLDHEIRCTGSKVIKAPCTPVNIICNILNDLEAQEAPPLSSPPPFSPPPRVKARRRKRLRMDILNACNITDAHNFCENHPNLCPEGTLKCKTKDTRTNKTSDFCLQQSLFCDKKTHCEPAVFSNIVISPCNGRDEGLNTTKCHNYWKMVNDISLPNITNTSPDEWVPFCDGTIKRKCGTEAPFRCPEGTCIDMDFVCDGENTCINGDDELDYACGLSSPYFLVSTTKLLILCTTITFVFYISLRAVSISIDKGLNFKTVCIECDVIPEVTSEWNMVYNVANDVLREGNLPAGIVLKFLNIHKDEKKLFDFYSYIDLRLGNIPLKEQRREHPYQLHKVVTKLYALERYVHKQRRTDVFLCWKRKLGCSPTTKNLLSRIDPPTCIDKLGAEATCKGTESCNVRLGFFNILSETLGLVTMELYILEIAKDFQQMNLLWVIYFSREQKTNTSPYGPMDLPLLIMTTTAILLAQIIMSLFMLTKEGTLFDGCEHYSKRGIRVLNWICSVIFLPFIPGALNSVVSRHFGKELYWIDAISRAESENDAKKLYTEYRKRNTKILRLSKIHSYLLMVHANVESAFEVLLLLCILAREPFWFGLDQGSIYDGVIRFKLFSNTWALLIFYWMSLALSFMMIVKACLTFVNNQHNNSISPKGQFILGLSFFFQYASCYVSMLLFISCSVPLECVGSTMLAIVQILSFQCFLVFLYNKYENDNFNKEPLAYRMLHTISNLFIPIPYKKWKEEESKNQADVFKLKQYTYLLTIKLFSNVTMMLLSFYLVRTFLLDNGETYIYFSRSVAKEMEWSLLHIYFPVMLGFHVLSFCSMAFYYKSVDLWSCIANANGSNCIESFGKHILSWMTFLLKLLVSYCLLVFIIFAVTLWTPEG